MVGTLNILIAEDDPNDTFLLARAFSKAAVQAPLHFVRDGQEVVDYLQGQNPFADRDAHPLPALLLLDLKMPRLDGFEVLQWVRRQEGLRRLLVVVFSSSSQIEDINRAYDLGANSYLGKPAASEDLFELVKSLEQYWLKHNLHPDCRSARLPVSSALSRV